MDQILSVLFYQPIVNLLLFLYKILFENLGLAVIAITIVLRLVLWPLYKKQLEAQNRVKAIQPKLKALQSQKKKATEYNAEEKEMLAESSKAFGAGCLPTLIQLPFLFALYNLIREIVSSNASSISHLAYFDFLKFPNDYVYHTSLFGLDFSVIPSHLGFGNFVAIFPYILIILLVIVTQFYATKLMSPTGVSTEEVKETKQSTKKKGKKTHAVEVVKNQAAKQPSSEDMQRMISQQTLIILPLLFGFLSWNFAAILSLYIIMQSLLSIMQTLIVNKKINIWKLKIYLKK